MKKKEINVPNTSTTLIFYAAITLIICVAFFLFVPKIASSLFPMKRDMLWNNFLTGVKNDKNIDAQTFWEFREFYSPGYFTFDKTATSKKVHDSIASLGFSIAIPMKTLLTFHSSHTESIDTLTSVSSLTSVIPPIEKKSVLFENDNAVIYKKSDKEVVIMFLKSEAEMKQAHGFFDYSEKDRELVKDHSWLNITLLSLP